MTQQHDELSSLSPTDCNAEDLRADSPLIIEDDDDLTSFLQRESTLDPSAADFLQEPDNLQRRSLSRTGTGQDGAGAGAARLTPFIFLLTVTACISGLLFGYDTGVISSTLVSVGDALTAPDPLSTLDKSLITSCTSLFALFASPLAGWLSDRRGRKSVIVTADALFVVGAAIQAVAPSVTMMVVGRSVIGIAVGAASLVVPLYISELSPPEFRGRLVVTNVLFITGGQVMAYLLGWWLSEVNNGWRWMVGLGAAPAALQLVLMFSLPETPRWLVREGRTEEARTILNRVYGAQASMAVDSLVRAISREVLEEEEALSQRSPNKTKSWLAHRPAGWVELFDVPGNRRALCIACLLQGLQQLCGFNALMYFMGTICVQLGFRDPILASFSVAVTNFIFTVAAMLLIDRVGRRRILLITIPFMALGLILCAGSFWFMDHEATRKLFAGTESAKLPSGQSGTGASSGWPLFILISIVIYVSGYATGLGNVPWQQSELFPLAVRSLGCGISTATCWGANFLVGLTFLPFMQMLGPASTFTIYAVICGMGWTLVNGIYPETKGLRLEEVGGLLRDDWGVRKTQVVRRERTD